MSIILPQQAIPLRNPYSVLFEQESDQVTTEHQYYCNHSNSNDESHDDGLDQMSVGSWSVIASTTGSDNEDEEDEEEDEILLNEESIAASLTVSNLGDGFTDISRTLTATSINSANLGGSDAWAIKVSKKKPITRKEGGSPSANAGITTSRYEGDDDEEMSLEEQYMQMTEHELSKSAKAVKLKNIRLSTAYDKELFRVLNVPDRKALPSRAVVTERSKTRGARAMDTD